MAEVVRIADVLGGKRPAGEQVTVQGWVRTRRDSKAGLSLRPGPRRLLLRRRSRWWRQSDAAQLRGRDPAPDRRLRRHRHRQSWSSRRARASRSRSRPSRSRWSAGSTIPTPTRSRPSATPSSTCARWPTCGRAPTPSAPSPGCATAWPRPSTASSTSTASTGSTRRSSPPATPRAPARCSASPPSTWPTCRARADGDVDFSQDFFGRRRFLTVSGQLNVETYCLAHDQGLHLRADLPRRELQHQPAPGRVLDDRAGDRLRRPARTTPTWPRTFLKYIFRAVLDERGDDMAFFAQRIDHEARLAAGGASSSPTSSA